ncbi:unnamed protein product, partial [Iphiclides podalirius]
MRTCQECKKSELECEWCHNTGCTKFPHLHCPKKILIAHLFNNKMNTSQPACTRIVTKSPIFVPANVRHAIKLEMEIDDIMLFKGKVICEIHIEERFMKVHGFLDKNIVYCDSHVFKTTSGVALGSIRLRWQSIVPFSNSVLIIAYNCHALAENCNQCQVLNKRFNCGWCEVNSKCGLIEECPLGYEPWFDENFKCESLFTAV